MTHFNRWIIVALLGGVLLTACGPGGPVRNFTAGEEIVEYTFAGPDAFEEGAYPGATLRIVDGVYRINIVEGDNELWWGQWGETLNNVVIDVDVTQTSERNENAYGVMCRVRGTVGQEVEVDPALLEDGEITPEATEAADATEATPDAEMTETVSEATAEATAETVSGTALDDTPASFGSGDGYLFLIQGNGQYAIMRARGRDVVPLVNWTQTDKINIGPDTNHLRAICADDYLALWINGEFMADVIDDSFESGQIGMAASAASRLGATIEFDNLTVTAAQPG